MGEATGGQAVAAEAPTAVPRTPSGGDAALMRAQLETEWSWRAAAYAIRHGYNEEDIQGMLRGPLSMPDVTALIDAARNAVAEERAAGVGPEMAPAPRAAESGLAHPEGERAGAGSAPAAVDGVDAMNMAEAHAAGLAAGAGEVRSENVEDLSRNEVEREDLEAASDDAASTARTAAEGAVEVDGAR